MLVALEAAALPRIHRSAVREAAPPRNGGCSFGDLTLLLGFSHTHHYDFFLF